MFVGYTLTTCGTDSKWHVVLLYMLGTVPPKLSISFNEKVALQDSMVQPVCSAIEGDLPVSFSWSVPGGSSDLTSQSSNTSAASTAITPSGSGYGVYTCIGSNSYGSSNITFRIIQAGKNIFTYLK